MLVCVKMSDWTSCCPVVMKTFNPKVVFEGEIKKSTELCTILQVLGLLLVSKSWKEELKSLVTFRFLNGVHDF